MVSVTAARLVGTTPSWFELETTGSAMRTGVVAVWVDPTLRQIDRPQARAEPAFAASARAGQPT